MSGDDSEFLSQWLDSFPHSGNCTNQFSEACCSCGKKEAQDALSSLLNPAPFECEGDCYHVDRIKQRVREVIRSPKYSTMTREEVAEKIRDSLYE